MALSGSSFKTWQVLGFTSGFEGREVGCCVPVACLWPDLLFSDGTFTWVFPAADFARFHVQDVCGAAPRSGKKKCDRTQPALWDLWLASQLNGSTLCLQRQRTQVVVILAVKVLLRDMVLCRSWST